MIFMFECVGFRHMHVANTKNKGSPSKGHEVSHPTPCHLFELQAPAADGSNHVVKQEAKQAAKPAAATQRRSSDGSSKKGPAAAAADNGKPAADKKQPTKKAPASAAKKVQANGAAGGKEVRVKKEFDLPGQSRETPDEVTNLTAVLLWVPGGVCGGAVGCCCILCCHPGLLCSPHFIILSFHHSIMLHAQGSE
jgi:hypothetical protein